MRRRRLFWQIFPTFALILLLAALALSGYAFTALRAFHLDETAADLLDRTRLLEGRIAHYLAEGRTAELRTWLDEIGQSSSTRFTVIDADGRVIADSHHDQPSDMDDHGDRPEIIEAMQGTEGRALRYSHTLGRRMLYVARPLGDNETAAGVVVRAATPVSALDAAAARIRNRILFGMAVVAALAAWAAAWAARRIAAPIGEMKRTAERFAAGDLEGRAPKPAAEELAGLAEALDRMAVQLDRRMSEFARQNAEQEAVLGSMIEGVIALDGGTRLLKCNAAASRLLGIEAGAVEGRALAELVRNPDLQRLAEASLETEAPIEKEFVLRRGEERAVRAQASALRDGAGRRIGSLIMLEDVTRLRRLERMRREFAANVSHELKTPITSIRGFVETLLEGAADDPAQARRFLSIVRHQTDRLDAIIDDLLALSRIEEEEKQSRIRRSPCRVRAMLEAAVQACRPKAGQRGIELKLHCDENLEIEANEALIVQAVANLIDNAIKFSDRGGEAIVEASAPPREVVVAVRDRGCGIEARHLPRLFERFYRIDKARSREAGGTGLGLAIVKHIAQAHGGRVTVESEPGEGSSFYLHLPRNGGA